MSREMQGREDHRFRRFSSPFLSARASQVKRDKDVLVIQRRDLYITRDQEIFIYSPLTTIFRCFLASRVENGLFSYLVYHSTSFLCLPAHDSLPRKSGQTKDVEKCRMNAAELCLTVVGILGPVLEEDQVITLQYCRLGVDMS